MTTTTPTTTISNHNDHSSNNNHTNDTTTRNDTNSIRKHKNNNLDQNNIRVNINTIITNGTEEQETQNKITTTTIPTEQKIAAVLPDTDDKDKEEEVDEVEENDAKSTFHWIEQLIAISNDRNDDTTTTMIDTNNNERSTIATTDNRHGILRLRNGEEINAKNTLQSFDTNTPRINRRSAVAIGTIATGNYNEEGGLVVDVVNNNSNREENTNLINIQATVVPSFGVVMDAQRVYSVIGTDVDTNEQSLPLWKTTSFKIYIIIGMIIIVSVVVGLFVYFGNDTASPSNNISFPTFSPTTLSKTEVMTTYINSVTLLDRNISIDGVTPEDIALRWMINDDPVFNTTESWLPIASFIETNKNTETTTSSIFTSKEQFVFIQRYALLTFWFQQVDNTGTFQRSWNSINGWLDRNECNWFGIECSALFLDRIDDEVGVVTEIVLNNNGITGTISADLGLLRWIRHITFVSVLVENSGSSLIFEEGLSGTIPSTAFGQWTALTYINVAGQSELIGTLPSTIGEWAALTYFAKSLIYVCFDERNRRM